MKVKFIIERCKSKAGYAARLQQRGKLNLERIKNAFAVLLDTPILLVIKVDGEEVIVHSYGELLFKKCRDLGLMQKVAEEIYDVGLEK